MNRVQSRGIPDGQVPSGVIPLFNFPLRGSGMGESTRGGVAENCMARDGAIFRDS